MITKRPTKHKTTNNRLAPRYSKHQNTFPPYTSLWSMCSRTSSGSFIVRTTHKVAIKHTQRGIIEEIYRTISHQSHIVMQRMATGLFINRLLPTGLEEYECLFGVVEKWRDQSPPRHFRGAHGQSHVCIYTDILDLIWKEIQSPTHLNNKCHLLCRVTLNTHTSSMVLRRTYISLNRMLLKNTRCVNVFVFVSEHLMLRLHTFAARVFAHILVDIFTKSSESKHTHHQPLVYWVYKYESFVVRFFTQNTTTTIYTVQGGTISKSNILSTESISGQITHIYEIWIEVFCCCLDWMIVNKYPMSSIIKIFKWKKYDNQSITYLYIYQRFRAIILLQWIPVNQK